MPEIVIQILAVVCIIISVVLFVMLARMPGSHIPLTIVAICYLVFGIICLFFPLVYLIVIPFAVAAIVLALFK